MPVLVCMNVGAKGKGHFFFLLRKKRKKINTTTLESFDVYLFTLYETKKKLDWSKVKVIAGDKINVTEKLKFVLGW